MSDVAWGELLRLGLSEMRLSPDVFWGLTPRELMLMSGHDGQGARVLDRQAMENLMAQFPDDVKDH